MRNNKVNKLSILLLILNITTLFCLDINLEDIFGHVQLIENNSEEAYNSLSSSIRLYEPPPRPEYDLGWRALVAPQVMKVNTYANFSIIIQNFGTKPASGYTINLMQEGNEIPLATIEGIYLSPHKEFQHFFDWVPTTIGKIKIYGQIVWDKNENPRSEKTTTISVDVMTPELYSNVLEGHTISPIHTISYLKYAFNRHITQTIFFEKELTPGIIHNLSLELTIHGNNIEPPHNTYPYVVSPPGRETLAREQGIDAPYSGKRIRFFLAMTDQPALETHSDWLDFKQFTLIYTELYEAYPEGFYNKNIMLDNPFSYTGGNLVLMSIKDDYSGFSWWLNNFMEGNQTLHWGISNLQQIKTIPWPITRKEELFDNANSRFFIWSDFTSIQFIKLSFLIEE